MTEFPSIRGNLRNISVALRWKILQGSVFYNGLQFDIRYTFSDYIEEDLVRFSV